MKTIKERFLAKIAIQADNCWLWLGSCSTTGGYGQFWDGDRVRRAHAVSYELFIGKIPEGKIIRHTCDVPRCVNPQHLLIGTQSENILDSVSRGRYRYRTAPRPETSGELNGRAILNVQRVDEIRSNPHISCENFAKIFSVSSSAVWRARNKKSWKIA